jgi:hypothetical protein
VVIMPKSVGEDFDSESNLGCINDFRLVPIPEELKTFLKSSNNFTNVHVSIYGLNCYICSLSLLSESEIRKY